MTKKAFVILGVGLFALGCYAYLAGRHYFDTSGGFAMDPEDFFDDEDDEDYEEVD